MLSIWDTQKKRQEIVYKEDKDDFDYGDLRRHTTNQLTKELLSYENKGLTSSANEIIKELRFRYKKEFNEFNAKVNSNRYEYYSSDRTAPQHYKPNRKYKDELAVIRKPYLSVINFLKKKGLRFEVKEIGMEVTTI